jgi:lysophospholipase L1-like esterase
MLEDGVKRFSVRCIAIGVISCSFAAVPTNSKQSINWVTTWSMAADSAGPPLKMKTVRQVIRTSIGGYALRIRLSNLFGSDVLTIGAVEVARHVEGSAIQSGTSHRISFGGHGAVTVAKGADIVSDPIEFPVKPMEELVVSVYIPNAAAATIHSVGLQTAYFASGDATRAVTFPEGETDDSRYLLTDVEVAPFAQGRAIVLVGDSITDGVGSTENANQRWSDALAALLKDNHAFASIAVVNAGMAGNRILHDGATPYLGPSLLTRFDRDVLAKPGVTWVLMLEGVNDISANDTLSDPREHVTADQIIGGMRELIERAHARGVKIWGATLLPYKGTQVPPGTGFEGPYFTAEGEAKRQAINHWIRTAHAFDAVVDLDSVMRDPFQPDRLRSDFDSGDHLHPNDAGYKAMAAAIDQRLFLQAS